MLKTLKEITPQEGTDRDLEQTKPQDWPILRTYFPSEEWLRNIPYSSRPQEIEYSKVNGKEWMRLSFNIAEGIIVKDGGIVKIINTKDTPSWTIQRRIRFLFKQNLETTGWALNSFPQEVRNLLLDVYEARESGSYQITKWEEEPVKEDKPEKDEGEIVGDEYGDRDDIPKSRLPVYRRVKKGRKIEPDEKAKEYGLNEISSIFYHQFDGVESLNIVWGEELGEIHRTEKGITFDAVRAELNKPLITRARLRQSDPRLLEALINQPFSVSREQSEIFSRLNSDQLAFLIEAIRKAQTFSKILV